MFCNISNRQNYAELASECLSTNKIQIFTVLSDSKSVRKVFNV